MGIAIVASNTLACSPGEDPATSGPVVGSTGATNAYLPEGGTDAGLRFRDSGTSGVGGSSPGSGGKGSSGGGAAAGGAGGLPAGASGGAGSQTALPLMCRLDMQCASAIVDEPKTDCTFQITDHGGKALYSDHAGVELRGRSSLGFPKKNYSIELRTGAGLDNPAPLLGMGKEADWVLDGSWVDRSFVRNDLVFWLYRDTGHYAPESRYCTLTLNGGSQGIYRLCEKIKRDDDRVILPEDDGSGNTFLIAQDSAGPLYFAVSSDSGDPSSQWKLVYPKGDAATNTQKATVQTWLTGLQDALSGTSTTDATSGIFSYLDFEAAVDWVIVEEFAKNIDGYFLSLHISRAAGERGRLIPWDLDLSMGQPTVQGGGTNESNSGWVSNRTRFINGLTGASIFRNRLAARWRELRAGTFSTANVKSKVDAMQSVLDDADLSTNFSKWPIGDVDFTPFYAPYTLYRVTSYTDEVQKLRAWIEGRLTWMDAHIDHYPN